MSDLTRLISDYEAELSNLKSKADVLLNPDNYLKQNNLTFHKDMSFTPLSDSDLKMSHVFLHKWNVDTKSFFTKDTIQKLHNLCVSEMVKRNIQHPTFDKLDNTIG